MSDNDIQCSRSGRSGPFGKNDIQMKTDVSAVVDNAFKEYRRLINLPAAEVHRNLLEQRLLGDITSIPAARNGREISLEAAEAALAAINLMSVDEYRRHVMFVHVFGVLKAERMIADSESDDYSLNHFESSTRIGTEKVCAGSAGL